MILAVSAAFCETMSPSVPSPPWGQERLYSMAMAPAASSFVVLRLPAAASAVVVAGDRAAGGADGQPVGALARPAARSRGRPAPARGPRRCRSWRRSAGPKVNMYSDGMWIGHAVEGGLHDPAGPARLVGAAASARRPSVGGAAESRKGERIVRPKKSARERHGHEVIARDLHPALDVPADPRLGGGRGGAGEEGVGRLSGVLARGRRLHHGGGALGAVAGDEDPRRVDAGGCGGAIADGHDHRANVAPPGLAPLHRLDLVQGKAGSAGPELDLAGGHAR